MNTSSNKNSMFQRYFHSLTIRMMFRWQVYLCIYTKDSLLKWAEIRDRTESQQKLATFLYKTDISRDRFIFVIYLIPSNKIQPIELAMNT